MNASVTSSALMFCYVSISFGICFPLLQIAKDTHGFVGADLSQLCMEAALRCIREQMHVIDVDADKIPMVGYDVGDSLLQSPGG